MLACAPPLSPGTILSRRYEVLRVVGSGGFGITYQCRDLSTHDFVAIKELCPPDAARDGLAIRPSNTDFFNEAKAQCRELARVLSHLRHAGIVRVLGSFEENDTLYVVMNYLDGDTLQHLIKRDGAQNPARVLDWTKQLSAALEAVHSLGLLHLDIKPDNVFLLHNSERVVLMDFDLAQKIHAPRDYRTRPLSLTAQCGTPGYAAPEQYSGQGRYSPATDLYALAATLFHALSGASPPPATERALGDAEIWPKNQKTTPLHHAIASALQIPTSRRPQTVSAFLALLNDAPAPDVSTQKRSRPGTRVLSGGAAPIISSNAASSGVTPAAPPMPAAYSLPPVNMRNDIWHEARFLRRDIVWPSLCACCLAPEETSVPLRVRKQVWHIPHCAACARHVKTSRDALPQALWSIIGGFFIAMTGLWKWGLFLGPLGFIVHFSGLSFWALKNGLADELTTSRCHETRLSVSVESVSEHGSVWKFKNPGFLQEVKDANAGYVE